MATVKMLKGNKYADIFDSPETIAQAEKEGYVLVKAEPKTESVKEEKVETVVERKTTRTTKK